MSFGREQKKLNDQLVFNPPPGYYQYEINSVLEKGGKSFGREHRFVDKTAQPIPGPGAYHNNTKDLVKKRLIEESQRKEMKMNQSNNNSNIKISSIPSIPKKSATRVYEELAPGILILHEEQYQNTSIGPGSYNVTDKMLHKKAITHKIAPQHPKKIVVQQQGEVNIPTIAEQIRNEKRQMYKQNLIKSSTINKSQISPSDLCLEVIILRQKLLRGDDIPPPGYYHNENNTAFKKNQFQKASDAQILGNSKEKRFKDNNNQMINVGPGSYLVEEEGCLKGGYIPKQMRKMHDLIQDKPGPGAYNLIQLANITKEDNKSSYPPIFGSGCNRFSSAPKVMNTTPGPGSYQISKKKNQKQKYIKIRKDLLQSSVKNGMSVTYNHNLNFGNDFSHSLDPKENKNIKHFYPKETNAHYFSSKVSRFAEDKVTQQQLGPGNYESSNLIVNRTFNKGKNGYVGSKQARFNDVQIRPKIGPGTYEPDYDSVRDKKTMNIFL